MHTAKINVAHERAIMLVNFKYFSRDC